jgi:hypothetical protein
VCDESSEQQQQPLLSMIQIPEKYTPKVTTPDKPVEKQPPFPMTGETLDTTNEPNHRSSESQRTVSEEPKRTTNAESSDNGAGPTPAREFRPRTDDHALAKSHADSTQSNRPAATALKINPWPK